MEKITKTFKNGEVLYAEDLNPIVEAVNQNTEDVNSLKRAVNALASENYKFAGKAAIDDEPAEPSMSVFRIASEAGVYTGYGLEVTAEDGVCAFTYDVAANTPAWSKLPLGIPFPKPAGMITENVETGTIEAQSNHYYNVAGDVETLELTLPTPTEGRADVVKVHFFAGQNLSMSADGGEHPVIYAGAALKPRWEYVLTFAFDGVKWNVTSESLTQSNCLVFQSDSEFTLSIDYREHTRLIEYSTDGFNWNTAGNNPISAVNNGRKYILLVRGRGNAHAPNISINTQGVVDCLGDVRTILDFAGPDSTQLAEDCFSWMFFGCTSLRTAPDLPARTLASGCYSNMFFGCTSLTQAPALPATTLESSCYSGMFEGCTSLAQAPDLPATTLASNCYSNMFNGCTSLTQAPALPATTLVGNCYSDMFRDCTSLTQAPALPATILVNSCYSNMFNGCTSLVQAPALPARTLAGGCYTDMFNGCTSLVQAPALPATTLASGCYTDMFNGCTSLTQAPVLPATTLESSCYSGMFRGCTSLTQAPDLPATILVSNCYSNMFFGCASLNNITMTATDISASRSLLSWVAGVAPNGTFHKAAAMETLPTGDSGIPTGWQVVNV